MKALVTCFEPFRGQTANSSLSAARRLPRRVAGVEITVTGLPVSFRRSIETAVSAIETCRPDFVISLGQAASRDMLNIERRAINLARAAAPDNDGDRPCGVPVIDGAPAACFTTLPVDSLAQSLKNHGYQCRVSDCAGTFVCNALYYSLLHHHLSTPSLFIHLPLTPRQAARRPAATPSLSSRVAAAAITSLIAMIGPALSARHSHV